MPEICQRSKKSLTMSKSYNELITLPTFEDRFMYLKIGGRVGEETFGFERYHNQKFYNSDPWRTFRRHIIERDMGCDLGLSDREIAGRIIIHHLNPITLDDILNGNPCVLDPNNVICVCHRTHEAIHYGDLSILNVDLVVRSPNDTCPWKL